MPQDKYALKFNGDGDHAPVGLAGSLHLSGASFTVEVWLKFDEDSDSILPILGTTEASENVGLHLTIVDRHPHLGFYRNDTRARTELAPDVWTHLAWRYDKTTQEQAIFVNGMLDISVSGHQPFQGEGEVSIGRYAGQYFFKGQMTELRIWRDPLDQTDIQRRMFERVSIDTPGLAECWPMNHGNGTELENLVPKEMAYLIGEVAQVPFIEPGPSPNSEREATIFSVLAPEGKIEIQHHEALNFSRDEEFAVEFWARLNVDPSSRAPVYLVDKGFESGPFPFSFIFIPNESTLYCMRGNKSFDPLRASIDPETLRTGFHVALVKIGPELLLLINGEVVANGMDPAENGRIKNTVPLVLGFSPMPAETVITELRIWKGARYPEQIMQWIDTRLEHVDPDEKHGLVGYWPLSEHQGSAGRNGISSAQVTFILRPARDTAEIWDRESGVPISPSDRTVAALQGGHLDTLEYGGHDFSKGFCMEAWVSPSGANRDLEMAPVCSAMGPAAGFELRCAAGMAEFVLMLDRQKFSIRTSSQYPITSDRWTHLAAVYNPARAEINLFVNGVMASHGSANGQYLPYHHGTLWFGRNSYWNKGSFSGQMANAILWNRPRVGAEIMQSLFGGPDSVDQTGLLHFWPLTGDFEGDVVDAAFWERAKAPADSNSSDKTTVVDVTEQIREKLKAALAESANLKRSNTRLTKKVDTLEEALARLPDLEAKLSEVTDEAARMRDQRDMVWRKIEDLNGKLEGIEALWLDKNAVALETVISKSEQQIAAARKEIASRGDFRLANVSLEMRMGLTADGAGAIFPNRETMELVDGNSLSSLKLSFEETSKKVATDLINVPDLAEQTETMARRTLLAAGLTAETQFHIISNQPSGGREMQGRVVGQAPEAGEMVESGSIVRIFIGRKS